MLSSKRRLNEKIKLQVFPSVFSVIESRMIFHECKSLILQISRNPSNLPKLHDSIRLFVLFYSSSKEKPTENTDEIFKLLQKHSFSSAAASRLASSLSHLKNIEKCDSILTYLKDGGFSVAHLEKLVKKRPALLGSNLERTIKDKIKIFNDLGFSSNDIADIVSSDPGIFSRSPLKRLAPSVMVLKELLGSTADVAEILKISGSFLRFNLEKNMVPNIEYLKSCGISTEQILKFIHSFPRFILYSPESMKKFVERADEMGCIRQSKMYIYAIRSISSMSEESWKQKLELFRDLGFSEEQILLAFQKKPQVFAISSSKIQKAVKLLLDSEIYDMSFIVRWPEVFICSVEKTLKPRLYVLEILQRKNLLRKRPGFYVIHQLPKQKFVDRYVLPYLGKVSELRLDDWKTDIHMLDIFGS